MVTGKRPCNKTTPGNIMTRAAAGRGMGQLDAARTAAPAEQRKTGPRALRWLLRPDLYGYNLMEAPSSVADY
jgi:hypothetical protein